ncbi:hypothetical protein ACMFMG_005071 [Clarireedia jacksonii]
MHITALLLLGLTGAQLATSLPVPAESAPVLTNAAINPQPAGLKAPEVHEPSSPPTNSSPALPGIPAGVSNTDVLEHRSKDVVVPNVIVENPQIIAARLGPDPEQVQKAEEEREAQRSHKSDNDRN